MPFIDLSRFDNSDFDRGAGRIKELVWMIVKAFFFQLHFPLPSVVRRMLLRMFGATVGRGVVIRSGVNITFPWRVAIGDHCWVGEDVIILSLDHVSIGESTCISQRTFLCTGSHDFGTETFDLVTGPVEIGRGCWIAAMVFVGPGVTVADGTLLKAGSRVFKTGPGTGNRSNPSGAE